MKTPHAAIALTLAGMAYAPALAAPSGAEVRQMPQSLRIEVGKMLYSANGKLIAPIYDIGPEGNPRIILGHRLVSIPAATVSKAGKRLVTGLSLSDLERMSQP